MTQLVAENLRAVWRNFALRGNRVLVVSGIMVNAWDRRRFEEHLPGCPVRLVLLRARPETIRDRIVRRRRLEAEQQQASLSEELLIELDRYAGRSARFAAALDHEDFVDAVIDIDDESPLSLATRASRRLALS